MIFPARPARPRRAPRAPCVSKRRTSPLVRVQAHAQRGRTRRCAPPPAGRRARGTGRLHAGCGRHRRRSPGPPARNSARVGGAGVQPAPVAVHHRDQVAGVLGDQPVALLASRGFLARVAAGARSAGTRCSRRPRCRRAKGNRRVGQRPTPHRVSLPSMTTQLDSLRRAFRACSMSDSVKFLCAQCPANRSSNTPWWSPTPATSTPIARWQPAGRHHQPLAPARGGAGCPLPPLVEERSTWQGLAGRPWSACSCNFGREILKHIPGRVSTEVDARLSFDTEGTHRQGAPLHRALRARRASPRAHADQGRHAPGKASAPPSAWSAKASTAT